MCINVFYLFLIHCFHLFVAKMHIMPLLYVLIACLLVFRRVCDALIYITWFFFAFKWGVGGVCIAV